MATNDVQFAHKTIEINGSRFMVQELTYKQGRELFKPNVDLYEINPVLVAMCLNNADGGTRTVADIEALPYPVASKLVMAALEICGLKKSDPGEAAAAAVAAE